MSASPIAQTTGEQSSLLSYSNTRRGFQIIGTESDMGRRGKEAKGSKSKDLKNKASVVEKHIVPSIDLEKLSVRSKDIYMHRKEGEKECSVGPSRISGNGLYIMDEASIGSIIFENTGLRFTS